MFLSKLWLSLKLKVCYTPNQIDFSQPGADTQPVGAKHIHLQPQDIPGFYMIQYQQSFKCSKIALSTFSLSAWIITGDRCSFKARGTLDR